MCYDGVCSVVASPVAASMACVDSYTASVSSPDATFAQRVGVSARGELCRPSDSLRRHSHPGILVGSGRR